VAQTLSYEVRLVVLVFGLLSTRGSYRLTVLRGTAQAQKFYILIAPMFVLWLVSCVAETNRTPFDFSEGESELVSGFNVEYGGGQFALIFIAEYAMIMFFSVLSVAVFGGHQPLVLLLTLSLRLCVF